MPRLCDPFFLFPEESPDGKWHLFGHTWVGIEHFISENGISWEPRKMVALRGGHSPSIYQENGGVYYLIYEKHNASLPNLKKGGRLKRREQEKVSYSRFEMCSSTDLILFSEPKIILDSREVPPSQQKVEEAENLTTTDYQEWSGGVSTVLWSFPSPAS